MNIEKVAEILMQNKLHDGYIEAQLKHDVERLGSEKAKYYVLSFSPSKLGRLGFLGLRKLAIVRRDHPDVFEKIKEVW